ncbi:MAG TPA: IclR family transcriptional regulator [Myxococcota bacterium]|nr:IclR family transcriptional regulator [Myxococcota bacterium]
MPKTSGKPKSEYAIQTVSNALRMLEVLQSETEIGVSDLARRLGLHKNNAFRLLATLELSGFVQQSPATELYRLGPACLVLGRAYSRSHGLMNAARPVLEELAAREGETAHLAILQDREVVHLDGALPERHVLSRLRVGARLPAHCTALGKTLLSARMAARIDPSGSEAEAGDPGLDGLPLQPFTEATIVDPEKLIEHLRAVQLHGYAIDSEEFAAGLCCVAAPVRDGNARVIAALSLSGPSARFSEERLHGEAASAIMTAATGLSRELGSPL